MKRYIKCETAQETLARYDRAYQKSISTQSLVKVMPGSYYYKGWRVTKDGGYIYPWNYEEPRTDNDPVPDHYPAKTLNECISSIDDSTVEV